MVIEVYSMSTFGPLSLRECYWERGRERETELNEWGNYKRERKRESQMNEVSKS